MHSIKKNKSIFIRRVRRLDHTVCNNEKKKMYILFYAKNMNTNIYLVCLCVCKAKRKPVSVIAAVELGNWGVSG